MSDRYVTIIAGRCRKASICLHHSQPFVYPIVLQFVCIPCCLRLLQIFNSYASYSFLNTSYFIITSAWRIRIPTGTSTDTIMQRVMSMTTSMVAFS